MSALAAACSTSVGEQGGVDESSEIRISLGQHPSPGGPCHLHLAKNARITIKYLELCGLAGTWSNAYDFPMFGSILVVGNLASL